MGAPGEGDGRERGKKSIIKKKEGKKRGEGRDIVFL